MGQKCHCYLQENLHIFKMTTGSIILSATASEVTRILFETSSTTAANNEKIFSSGDSLTCSTCLGLSSVEAPFCTCTEDPYDAVDVLKEVPELRVTLVTYFVCIIFGAVGNLITLFTMATADRKNKSGTNIFLISLSVSLEFFTRELVELLHFSCCSKNH
jgi:hypothetical protein